MANALQVGEAKFIMTTPESLEIASAAASQVGMPLKNIFLLECSGVYHVEKCNRVGTTIWRERTDSAIPDSHRF
jgi:hypothetical protein